MKKIFLYSILFLCGGIAGYFANSYTQDNIESKIASTSKNIKDIEKEVVFDTIHIQTPSPTQKAIKPLIIRDTIFIIDSIPTKDLEEDKENLNTTIESDEYESNPDEETIITEELITKRSIDLRDSNKLDSADISKILDFKSKSFSNTIVVEFWKSPLNITGYELSRNRLKLFGFNPNDPIILKLDNNEDQIVLTSETINIVLQKTKQFKTLKL